MNTNRWIPPLGAAACLVALLAAGAAVAAVERQVPLDQKGRVGVIDSRLARRLGLFTDEHPGFVEARLLATDDGAHVLELLVRDGGDVLRSRQPLGAAQVDSLRAVVQERIGLLAPEAGLNQEGRAWMLAGDALMGLGFYGWAVPVVLDVQDGRGAAGTYMVVSGLAYFVPFAVTQEAEVTYAMANLGFYGQSRGILHGVLLARAADARAGEADGRTAVGTALVASLAEGAIGNLWARGTGMTPGHAATLVTGGDFGMAYGLCAADLAGALEADDDDAAVALSTLGGYAAGLGVASALASRRDYTYGDAGVMRVGGLVGGYLGASVTWLDEDADSRATSAGILAGSVLGLVVGDRAVRGAGFSGAHNVISHLGASAGALMGLGVGFLTTQGSDADRSLGVWSALGAAGGWALTVSQMPRAGGPGSWRERSSNAANEGPAPKVAWGVEPRREGRGREARLVPQVTLRARF